MSFYTSVVRYGNSMLYRGYDSAGKRVSRKDFFKPTFFTQSRKDSEWRGLDGTPVSPIQFENMRESRNWLEQNKDVAGRHIFGNPNYLHQYITSKFPNEIKFRRELINVSTIDIETDYDNGFPHPSEASQKILAITIKNSTSPVYWVWGYGDYDVEKALIKPVRYVKCEDEHQLLTRFLDFINDPNRAPDVITGWNTRFFDIPYLVNRTAKVLGLAEVKRFSPWGMVDYRKVRRRMKEEDTYDIKGIQTLDYLELFQKFGYSYGAQESYKLNHIANVVLGEKKLSYEESGSLKNLYKDDFQKYIDYNMKDVELVDRLEEKMGLITLAMTIAYKGGVNYQDTFGVTAIWESIIYRYLNKQKRVPSVNQLDSSQYQIIGATETSKKNPSPAFREEGKSHQIAGGYVKDPKPGAYDWVVSFDLNSLYPNIIVQANISPETLMPSTQWLMPGVKHYLNTVEPESNHSIAANGTTYSKKVEGVIPSIITEYYDERVSVKNMMLAAMKDYQVNKTVELEREINTLENRQMAIKILLNSLYGALANKYFKYFHPGMAEGVTLTGQTTIKWAERAMNGAMNSLLKTEKDYVIAIDTDSIYVNFNALVKELKPKDPVKFLDKICKEHFEPMIAKSYDAFFTRMNHHTKRMEMAREVIADRGVWTAKKRYILNVHNSEGVQYAEPKLKIMGIEAIKSSTPEVVRDKFKEVFKIIMAGDEKETQDFISRFKTEFKQLPPEQVAFPRGTNNISEWSDRKITYKKGTPIHVRGALLYNKYIKAMKLTNKYEIINNGDRVKFTYLRVPNSIRENVVSFPDVLPEEFKLHNYVDYDLQFEKTFIEPLNFILHAVGWSAEEQASLDAFFN